MCYICSKRNSFEVIFMNTASVAALRKCTLFSSLGDGEASLVFSNPAVCEQYFKKGELIFGHDSFRNALGIIIKGSARVKKGSDTLMSSLSPGSVFGMPLLFCDCGEFPTEITAVTDCCAVFFEKSYAEGLFTANPALARAYISLLSNRIHFLSLKIDTFVSPDVRSRLLCFLEGEYAQSGRSDGIVSLPYSMTALASRLSVGRTSLYRELNSLEKEGIIKRLSPYEFLIRGGTEPSPE